MLVSLDGGVVARACVSLVFLGFPLHRGGGPFLSRHQCAMDDRRQVPAEHGRQRQVTAAVASPAGGPGVVAVTSLTTSARIPSAPIPPPPPPPSPCRLQPHPVHFFLHLCPTILAAPPPPFPLPPFPPPPHRLSPCVFSSHGCCGCCCAARALCTLSVGTCECKFGCPPPPSLSPFADACSILPFVGGGLALSHMAQPQAPTLRQVAPTYTHMRDGALCVGHDGHVLDVHGTGVEVGRPRPGIGKPAHSHHTWQRRMEG
jgi:hypothetical protein